MMHSNNASCSKSTGKVMNVERASDAPEGSCTRRRWIGRISKIMGVTIATNLLGSKLLNAEDSSANLAGKSSIEPRNSAPASSPKELPTGNSNKNEIDYKAISKAEWKKRLTPQQYKVAREHGTERAFSGEYFDSKADGIYKCVCCESILFDSTEKFDSKTGWPSFWQPKKAEVVGETTDHLIGYPRTEVHCSKCDAHLGHVFNDAPQTPTGLRYCINSVCLTFVPRAKAIELKQDDKP